MNRRLTILIVSFILAFTIGTSVGQYVLATDLFYQLKEFSLGPISRLLASHFMSMLSDNVIKGISNLGTEQGKNSPLFVQNWKQFLGQGSDLGTNQFRAQLQYSIGNNIVCDNLKKPLGQIFNSGNASNIDIGSLGSELLQGSLNLFQNDVKCTIPKTVSDQFGKDFKSGGGWDTWTRMFEPQNNLAGALGLSLEELGKQQNAQHEARANEVVAGQGFAGLKNGCAKATTTSGTVCYNQCYDPLLRACNLIPDNARKQTCVKDADASCTTQCKGQTSTGANGQCIFMGQVTTPAKVFGEGAAQWLDSKGQWFANSNELFDVLTGIVSGVMGRLTNFAIKATGAGSLVDQFNNELGGLTNTETSNTTAGKSNLQYTTQQSQQQIQHELCIAQCNNNKDGETPDQYFACTAKCP